MNEGSTPGHRSVEDLVDENLGGDGGEGEAVVVAVDGGGKGASARGKMRGWRN